VTHPVSGVSFATREDTLDLLGSHVLHEAMAIPPSLLLRADQIIE